LVDEDLEEEEEEGDAELEAAPGWPRKKSLLRAGGTELERKGGEKE
jgi:hypothetical protein